MSYRRNDAFSQIGIAQMKNSINESQDGSMWLRRASGVKLISAQIAVEIARLVVKEQYGQLEVDRNEPFSVIDSGDAWIVTGHESPEFNAKNPPEPTWSGPLRMSVSQFDGQILNYVFTFEWSKATVAANPKDAQ
jgi:hypothetical protein